MLFLLLHNKNIVYSTLNVFRIRYTRMYVEWTTDILHLRSSRRWPAAAGGPVAFFFDTRHSQRIPVNCTYARGKKVNEKTLEMRMERKTELKKRTAFCFAFWRKMYGTESEVLVQFRRRRRRFLSTLKRRGIVRTL